jgi:hypothetical protein
MSYIPNPEFRQHPPRGVKQIIAYGFCAISKVDDTTVLKYAHLHREAGRIQTEAKILSVLGSHPRIVQSKGLTEDGLLLEFAPNGNLYDYLTAHPEVPLDRRLAWCIHAAEAMAYIHSKRVLHCDIRHANFLLDANLDLKLADFQGQHFSVAGEVLLDGGSGESTKAHLPRKPADHVCVRTDLFALGGAIYFIMMGHEVFPDLDKHKDEVEIERRFREREFPTDAHACAAITAGCWNQLYSSAQQVLTDLEAVQDAVAGGETLDTVAKSVVYVASEDGPSTATSWLTGLCDGMHIPKAPRRRLELVGSD